MEHNGGGKVMDMTKGVNLDGVVKSGEAVKTGETTDKCACGEKDCCGCCDDSCCGGTCSCGCGDDEGCGDCDNLDKLEFVIRGTVIDRPNKGGDYFTTIDEKSTIMEIYEVLLARIQELEIRVEVLEIERKVSELLGKGERYETQLLDPKPHTFPIVDKDGKVIKAEPIKSEHIVKGEDLFNERFDSEID